MQSTISFFGKPTVRGGNQDLFVIEIAGHEISLLAGIQEPEDVERHPNGVRSGRAFPLHAREAWIRWGGEGDPVDLPPGIWVLTSDQLSRCADLGDLDADILLPLAPAEKLSRLLEAPKPPPEPSKGPTAEEVATAYEALDHDTLRVLWATSRSVDEGMAHLLTICADIHDYKPGTDYPLVESQTRERLDALTQAGLLWTYGDDYGAWDLTELGWAVATHK